MTYVLLGADGRPLRSDVKGQWGGHRRARIYGRLDCPSALRAITRGGYVRHLLLRAGTPLIGAIPTFVTLAPSAPDRKAWMSQPCCSCDVDVASISYPRSRTG
jgi:hypothetical protein